MCSGIVGVRLNRSHQRVEMCSFRQSRTYRGFYAKGCHNQICNLEMLLEVISRGSTTHKPSRLKSVLSVLGMGDQSLN